MYKGIIKGDIFSLGNIIIWLTPLPGLKKSDSISRTCIIPWERLRLWGNLGNSGQWVIPDNFFIINHLIMFAQIKSDQTPFGTFINLFFHDSMHDSWGNRNVKLIIWFCPELPQTGCPELPGFPQINNWIKGDSFSQGTRNCYLSDYFIF